MMVDSLIEQKRAQRKALLRALYGLVDGREGFTITPMQYFALGTQIGLQQDVTGQTVRFLASEGLLEYKPASEAVALTHNGVVEVERQRNESAAESQKAQLEALPQLILSVLRHKLTKLQMEELKESLPDFSDLPDSDWYVTINDLLSDGMIDARVVRSGIYDAVGAAYNIGITQRGRALTPDSPIESTPLRDASSESDDRKFARLAIEEARKSLPEDERVHPRVGVVVVRDGRVLATAHRGEVPQCHAEYVALEKKLGDVALAGSTVYTTLEPCTSRNHPKVPCAIRLAERKVARVVIGMLDPDDRISGRGQRTLRKAGIATELFDHDLMTEIEELNRDFIRDKEVTEHRVTAPSSEHDSEHSPVGVSPQTEAARRLSDATKDLQKAAWSFVELHSRYGVAQAARDVAEEEKKILQKVRASLDVFEREYDLPADLARVVKEELANINISLDRLTSGHELETMKIAAEQVQDSCHRIREAAKPYAYLHADAGDAGLVQKVEPAAARPIIIPKRYGEGVLKDDMGYTGLAVVNDGEPAYDITISNIAIKDGARLEFHRGHTERLTKGDGEAFYPAFVAMKLGGTFGNGLFDFMRERGVQRLAVPITYRDSGNNWFQTEVTLERDVEKSGGLRLGWAQKQIPEPTSEDGPI